MEKEELLNNSQADLQTMFSDQIELIKKLDDKIDSLTSSKLKAVLKLVARHPMVPEDSGLTGDIKEAYDILVAIKELYLNQFLAGAINHDTAEKIKAEGDTK
jgi:hypothetical protein